MSHSTSMLPVAAPISGLFTNASAMARTQCCSSTTSLSTLTRISPVDWAIPVLSALDLPPWSLRMTTKRPVNGPTAIRCPRMIVPVSGCVLFACESASSAVPSVEPSSMTMTSSLSCG